MTTILDRMWQSLVARGFKLLYNELAWLYDPVSWVASRGRWRRWQRTSCLYLPAQGKVLDVGCGPGHLLTDLAADAYQPVGLDLSSAMLRLARRGLQRRGVWVSLCHSRAQALPFAPGTFSAVVSTFPTAYIYDPDWLSQVHRVLEPGGRLIIVEMVSFVDGSRQSQCLDKLYQITGQRRPAPDLVDLLEGSGLLCRREAVNVDGSIVDLIVAIKQG